MPVAVLIIFGLLFLVVLSGRNNERKGSSGSSGGAKRIDREHYYDPDDYECSVCGARFEEESTVCPNCGARFEKTEEDDDEFIDEMLFWDDED